MRKIFLAHPSSFVQASLKEFALEQHIDLYIWDDYDDFSYLLDDLKPELLIIHQDILKSKAANIQNGISNAKFNNFLIASLGDVDTEISVDYKLPLDLDPSTFFVELLESTLKKH